MDRHVASDTVRAEVVAAGAGVFQAAEATVWRHNVRDGLPVVQLLEHLDNGHVGCPVETGKAVENLEAEP